MVTDCEKLKWGQQNVGIPGVQVREAINKLRSTAEFSSVRYDVIEYYCNQFLFRCLPEELDSALTTDELRALAPNTTKVVFILLIRDFIRRYHDCLVPCDLPQKWEGQWVEQFTTKLLEITDAPVQPYVQWMSRWSEGEEEDPQLLIVGLARQLCVDPEMLLQLHLAMCEVAEEDLLQGAGATSRQRPWWKLW